MERGLHREGAYAERKVHGEGRGGTHREGINTEKGHTQEGTYGDETT